MSERQERQPRPVGMPLAKLEGVRSGGQIASGWHVEGAWPYNVETSAWYFAVGRSIP